MSEIETPNGSAFEDKASILAELWIDYRNDDNFTDFIEYNDLGLPLAYAVTEGIVESTTLAAKYIEETFDLLLAAFDIEDTGFENLEDLIAEAGE